MAEHKIVLKSYNDYLGIEEAGKELILYTVGDYSLASLKKQYIGFGDLSVLAMIGNLHLKPAIKTTTTQKHKYKTMGDNNPWDPTTSITAYFTQLDSFLVSLGNRSIATSKAKKTMMAETQMWQSKMFTLLRIQYAVQGYSDRPHKNGNFWQCLVDLDVAESLLHTP